jgi:hypothetical protein
MSPEQARARPSTNELIYGHSAASCTRCSLLASLSAATRQRRRLRRISSATRTGRNSRRKRRLPSAACCAAVWKRIPDDDCGTRPTRLELVDALAGDEPRVAVNVLTWRQKALGIRLFLATPAALGFAALRPRSAISAVPEFSRIIRLTSGPDREGDLAISPDEKRSRTTGRAISC